MEMLDLHTHILPGMDDGSASVEESLAMLRAEMAQGVKTVALTPHFYPDRETPDCFLARRAQSWRLLQTALTSRAEELPRMLLGAEVAYYEGISGSEAAQRLCIGQTGAMLVEMPFCPWSERMVAELYELLTRRGIRPVVAHVERYLSFQKKGLLQELCENGVWIQANASFFARWQTSRRAIRMLNNCEIHFIGTDCHNLSSRKPNMSEAVARIAKKTDSSAQRHLNSMRKQLEGV